MPSKYTEAEIAAGLFAEISFNLFAQRAETAVLWAAAGKQEQRVLRAQFPPLLCAARDQITFLLKERIFYRGAGEEFSFGLLKLYF
jgi:hypothetical protein